MMSWLIYFTSDMATLIDSYSETNQDQFTGIGGAGANPTDYAQSFTASVSTTLTSCKFYMYREQNPTGNIVAKLWAHTGVYGTSSKPGTLLATSDSILASSIPATSANVGLIEFTFSGANQYALVSGTTYCIGLTYTTGSSVSFLVLGYDISSPTHSGNYATNFGGWSANSGRDIPFYVYGASAQAATPSAYRQLMGVG